MWTDERSPEAWSGMGGMKHYEVLTVTANYLEENLEYIELILSKKIWKRGTMLQVLQDRRIYDVSEWGKSSVKEMLHDH